MAHLRFEELAAACRTVRASGYGFLSDALPLMWSGRFRKLLDQDFKFPRQVVLLYHPHSDEVQALPTEYIRKSTGLFDLRIGGDRIAVKTPVTSRQRQYLLILLRTSFYGLHCIPSAESKLQPDGGCKWKVSSLQSLLFRQITDPDPEIALHVRSGGEDL